MYVCFLLIFRTSLRTTLSRKLVVRPAGQNHFPLFTWGSTRAAVLPNWFSGNQLPLLNYSDPLLSTLASPDFQSFTLQFVITIEEWSGFWACLVDIFKWMHPPHVITEKRWWMAFQTPCYYTFLIYLPVPLCKTTSNEFYSKPTKKKSTLNWQKRRGANISVMIMMVTKKCCFWKMIRFTK